MSCRPTCAPRQPKASAERSASAAALGSRSTGWSSCCARRRALMCPFDTGPREPAMCVTVSRTSARPAVCLDLLQPFRSKKVSPTTHAGPRRKSGVDEPSGRPPALSRAGIERGFLANSQLIIASRIATAGLSLITVPVLVAHFGVDGYGSWEALLALASLSSMAQTAIAGTLVWRASTAYAIGDAEEL